MDRNCSLCSRTRNQKHHLEGNAILAGCNAKCWAPRVESIAISIVTIHSIWHNAFDSSRVGKFPPHICESCGATYRYSHESFSALQGTSICLTDVENCVQADP